MLYIEALVSDLCDGYTKNKYIQELENILDIQSVFKRKNTVQSCKNSLAEVISLSKCG